MMHEFYNQNNMDVLFVGSSHCYRSFNPLVADKVLNKNTFNAGSSNQRLDASYFLIKEALKKYQTKEVCLELHYWFSMDVLYKEQTQMTATYIISDFAKPSLDKLSFLLNASNSKYYVNSFLIGTRNRNKIFDFDYIKRNLKTKNSAPYKNYDYSLCSRKNEWYAGKGFVASNELLKSDAVDSDKTVFDLSSISKDWKRDLFRIIDFCNKNDIKLSFVVAPVTGLYLADRNYDEYHSFINDIAVQNDIFFYDSNVLNNYDYSFFKDIHHLNEKGANRFTNDFCNEYLKMVSYEE